jgi:hypothetical protein
MTFLTFVFYNGVGAREELKYWISNIFCYLILNKKKPGCTSMLTNNSFLCKKIQSIASSKDNSVNVVHFS